MNATNLPTYSDGRTFELHARREFAPRHEGPICGYVALGAVGDCILEVNHDGDTHQSADGSRWTVKEPKPTVRVLIQAHGVFEVDPDLLYSAILQAEYLPTADLKREAAVCCGHPDPDAFAKVTRLEALTMWVESGNHFFRTVAVTR